MTSIQTLKEQMSLQTPLDWSILFVPSPLAFSSREPKPLNNETSGIQLYDSSSFSSPAVVYQDWLEKGKRGSLAL